MVDAGTVVGVELVVAGTAVDGVVVNDDVDFAVPVEASVEVEANVEVGTEAPPLEVGATESGWTTGGFPSEPPPQADAPKKSTTAATQGLIS